MRNIQIGKLLSSYGFIAATSQMLEAQNQNLMLPMDVRGYDQLIDSLHTFIESCDNVGMPVSKSAAEALLTEAKQAELKDNVRVLDVNDLTRTKRCAASLLGCVKHESPLKFVYIIPTEKQSLIEPVVPIFGEGVNLKFPSATYEITEASKCLGLGRATACVFHLMRTIEAALRAIHCCLCITTSLTGNDRNWGSILRRIRKEIDGREKWSEKEYFQEIYARLDAIKDSWRNSTMHVETIYTEQEAFEMFNMTNAFMQKIAARMDENGLPLA